MVKTEKLWRVSSTATIEECRVIKEGPKSYEVEGRYNGSNRVLKDTMQVQFVGRFYTTHEEAVRKTYERLQGRIARLKVDLKDAEESRDKMLCDYAALLVVRQEDTPNGG